MNQGWNYYRDKYNRSRYRDKSRDIDGDWERKGGYKDKSGFYVPPGNMILILEIHGWNLCL